MAFLYRKKLLQFQHFQWFDGLGVYCLLKMYHPEQTYQITKYRHLSLFTTKGSNLQEKKEHLSFQRIDLPDMSPINWMIEYANKAISLREKNLTNWTDYYKIKTEKVKNGQKNLETYSPNGRKCFSCAVWYACLGYSMRFKDRNSWPLEYSWTWRIICKLKGWNKEYIFGSCYKYGAYWYKWWNIKNVLVH